MNEYVAALKNYAIFSGKATRRDYWTFVLANLVISILISFFNSEMLNNIYSLALVIPSLAIGARRLHDIGRTGWWQLLWLVPIVGWIILIIFFVQPSKTQVVMEKEDEMAEKPVEVVNEEEEKKEEKPEESMSDSSSMQTEQSEGSGDQM